MSLTLLKAMLSQDMNIFKYSTKRNSSKFNKIMLPLCLSLIIMGVMGGYAYKFAEELSKYNITYMMLSIFSMLICIMIAFKGIYKTQGILFESKDNDLLFSLPIPKRKIFAVSIIKLIIYNTIYSLLFLIPIFVVYIIYETPEISFYIISILFSLFITIIPTIIACIFGYFIKLLSSKFKSKKLMQIIFTLVLMFAIYIISFNLDGFLTDIASKATSINDVITKIYYPVGTYITLINEFSINTLIIFILINIVPLIIFIYLGSIYYYNIIAKFNENGRINRKKINIKYQKNSQLVALIKKELSKFFSTPVYMINSIFGVFMLLLITIGLCTKNDTIGTLNIMLQADKIENYIPYIYCQIILFVGCLTCITSSSISLEGKHFNIIKSLPIKPKKVLLSKILTSDLLSIPLILISDLIFILNFNISIIQVILILLFSFVIPTYTAVLGLIINLKYPKMNASNDTEVVKQSMSSMISVFLGMGVFGILTIVVFYFFNYINIMVTIEIVIFIFVTLILWIILKKYGERRFMDINV